MAHIVAAQFDEFAAADSALDALRGQGFSSSDVTKFFLNPPGRHADFPIGGDELADPNSEGGASGAVKGAALGSAAGLALGLAATPIVGPAAAIAAAAGAAAAGAYTGSLAGAASELGKDDTHPEAPHPDTQPAASVTGGAQPSAPTERPSGVIVAVNVASSEERERATSVFWRHRAHSIELAEGTWNDGTWQDFDPLSVPHWHKAPSP